MESDELPLVVSRLDDFEGHSGYNEPPRHRRSEPDSARHTDRRSMHRKDHGGHSRARDPTGWAPEYSSSTSSHRHYPQSSVTPYDRHSGDYRHHGDDSHNERWASPPGPSRYSQRPQSERTREWEMDHHSQSHSEHYYNEMTQTWDYTEKETYGRWTSRRGAQAPYDEHRSDSPLIFNDAFRQYRESIYLRANWDRESMPPPHRNGNPAEGSGHSSSRSWAQRQHSTQTHNQQRLHPSSQQYTSPHSQNHQYENKHRDWRHDDGTSSQTHSKKKKRKHNHSTHHHHSKGVHDLRGHSSTHSTNYDCDPPEVSPSRRFQKNERTRMKEQSRQHRYDYSRSPSRSPSRSRSSRASSRHDDSRPPSRNRSVTPEYRSSRRRGTKRPRSVSSNPSVGSRRSRGRSSYHSRAESRERSYSSGSSRSRKSSPRKRTVHRLPGAGDKTTSQQRTHNITSLSTDRASLAAALPAVARSSLDTPTASSYHGAVSTDKHTTPMAPASFRPSQPVSSVERMISTVEGSSNSNSSAFGSRFKPIKSNEPSLLKRFFPRDEDEEMEDVKSTGRATSGGWQRVGPATSTLSDHGRDAGVRPSEAQSEGPLQQPAQQSASSKLGLVSASSLATAAHPPHRWAASETSPWDYDGPRLSGHKFEGPLPEPAPSGPQAQSFGNVSPTSRSQQTSTMQAPASYPSIPPSPRAAVQSTSAQEAPLPSLDKLPKGKDLYQIVSQVGEGTFGKVFKAENVLTGKFVALKRIRMEQERDGFPVTAMREIKLLQSLKHPNVINLHEMMVSKGGSVYMVFEYMDHDLTGILSQQNFHFTDANLKSLCQQMLAGIAYLHQKAVIHRDMKGSNILINNQGILKIADFGLARFYQKRRRADYTNRVITLWYRPPELLLGATVYGPEVDMWSVGCIMLELYVKKPVFQGVEEMSQLDCIYQLMGTPSVDEWPGFADLPWYELVKPTKKISNRFRTAFQKYLSPAALDLAQRLLEYDPAKRITAAEALDQPFFTTEEPRAALPVDLASLEGEWHEYESKIEREKRKRKQKRESGGAPNAGTNEPLETA